MKIINISIFLTLVPVVAMAVDFPTTDRSLSKYGQIQNVQNYSTNPFWDKDSPYNQRLPQPVYVQGAKLSAGDCAPIIANLVANECAVRNYCADSKISDIRPAVMVSLSQMTGANYSGSCGGYIDAAFNNYTTKNKPLPMATGFPSAITPGNNSGTNGAFKIENPYAPSAPKWHDDNWYGDIVGRAVELGTLQAQNGAAPEKLAPTAMPKTISDLSFVERQENAAASYEKWADNSAYKTIQIESDKERYIREAAEAVQIQAKATAQAETQKMKDKQSMTTDAFCEKYPSETGCELITKLKRKKTLSPADFCILYPSDCAQQNSVETSAASAATESATGTNSGKNNDAAAAPVKPGKVVIKI